jgi:hypothetical protein
VPCIVHNQVVNDSDFPNLVKQSTSGSTFWVGTFYDTSVISPIRAATGNSTATPSANGRAIQPGRWNACGLLGDPGSQIGAEGNAQAPPDYVPPDWILMTRVGALTNAAPTGLPSMATLSDRRSNNPYYIVGRYAYAIYDEGGLMDINVAGFPSSLISTDFPSKRGVLPQIDLANIPGIDTPANANSVVTWRNAASATSAATYTNYVLGATNGFMTVLPGDQSFVSRKDLIEYVKSNPSVIKTSALQYLGTFSRELNAPSYTPPLLGSNRPPVLPGDGYRYVQTAGNGTFAFSESDPGPQDDLFNPSLINTRVTQSFVRNVSDNTSAQVGEPLIKYRFPLSRLNWVGYQGISGAKSDGTPPSSGDLMNSFGLSFSGGVWTYNHGTINGRGNGQSILFLSDVAALGREPDFFELLQAGILVGSLGKGGGNSEEIDQIADSSPYNQVIQIGANIINQYNTDSFPRRLLINGSTFSGDVNLPYILRVFETPYRYQGSATVGLWYQPEVWNPHAGATTPPTAANGPTKFRFIVAADPYSFVQFYSNANEMPTNTATGDPYGTPMPMKTAIPNVTLANSQGITFNSGDFSTPTLLTNLGVDGASASGLDNVSDGDTQFIGVCFGTVQAPDYRVTPSQCPDGPQDIYNWETPTLTQVKNPGTAYTTYQLQYELGGEWITYDTVRNVALEISNLSVNNDPDEPPAFQWYHQYSFKGRSDPRTDHFGVFGCDRIPAGPFTDTPRVINPNPPLGYYWGATFQAAYASATEYPRWTTTANNVALSAGPLPGPGGSFVIFPGALADNLTASPTYYADPDGVVRNSDGAYTQGSMGPFSGDYPNTGGYPLDPSTNNSLNDPLSRPMVLNRPFRSVAELGYVFRGTPWKHLDFFTSKSADAALLDLFCLNEMTPPANPAQSTDPVPQAGRIDLNTRQTAVLQAALMGAVKAEDDNDTINQKEAQFLASNLVKMTSAAQGALQNRSELVTRWISDPSIPSYTTTAGDPIIKRRREAAIRALADVGNTRTWNLLIDLIAQSGSYAPAAKTLDQFTVTGERHYWFHVAIDRFTGKVIEQSLETADE